MPSSPFSVRKPLLFFTNASAVPITPSSSSNQAKEHQLSAALSDISSLYDGHWRMIASSSTMWQDRKRNIDMVYAPVKGDPVAFTSETTWCAEGSDKRTTTKGVNRPRSTDAGVMYDWRGLGWLRLITTQWELIALGQIPHGSSRDTGDQEETKQLPTQGSEIVALVTFVQKTLFSPTALSVLVPESSLDGIDEAAVLEYISAALRAMGIESLTAEANRMKLL
ncbi:hypothetical protein B0I35DRAFT_424263 [Stachybotrys elegans]|uniref:Uncharacterized protein n=1 Tax=Stachybotrys elegans TaxID=80388 RepID=A0A8K0WU86_9HYPO|nr:hypothetical protein B0I35DRAFT_424263 [Stachybotrys elegans]